MVNITIRHGKSTDIEKLIPLYKEFLSELGLTMTKDQIIKSLMFCASNIGMLIIGFKENKVVAIAGGIFQNDSFVGEIVYVKPELRGMYKFISKCIREIKNKAKSWDIICGEERVKTWTKIGFKVHKYWLRREL